MAKISVVQVYNQYVNKVVFDVAKLGLVGATFLSMLLPELKFMSRLQFSTRGQILIP
jgi:hypothetical protein